MFHRSHALLQKHNRKCDCRACDSKKKIREKRQKCSWADGWRVRGKDQNKAQSWGWVWAQGERKRNWKSWRSNERRTRHLCIPLGWAKLPLCVANYSHIRVAWNGIDFKEFLACNITRCADFQRISIVYLLFSSTEKCSVFEAHTTTHVALLRKTRPHFLCTTLRARNQIICCCQLVSWVWVCLRLCLVSAMHLAIINSGIVQCLTKMVFSS